MLSSPPGMFLDDRGSGKRFLLGLHDDTQITSEQSLVISSGDGDSGHDSLEVLVLEGRRCQDMSPPRVVWWDERGVETATLCLRGS